MVSALFQSAFNAWLDKVLAAPIAPEVIAFSFNLAEPWCIEIIGAASYSEEDSDWACDEAFRPKIRNLDLPESEVGNDWETVLESSKRILGAYIDRPSAGSAILKKATVVAVGFVDGDLHKVWPR
jgi:shikimate kinase